MQYLDVCSECLAAADSHQLKQVIHMSVPKHKEMCDKIATLQKQLEERKTKEGWMTAHPTKGIPVEVVTAEWAKNQIATLQKRQLELGMKNDAMAVAVQATWAAWTEGGDFNVAKRMVKRAMDLIK